MTSTTAISKIFQLFFSLESLEQKSAGTAAKQLLSYKQTELKNIQEVADSLSSEIKKKEISTLLKQKNTELEKEGA